jgi:hypothetical protein
MSATDFWMCGDKVFLVAEQFVVNPVSLYLKLNGIFSFRMGALF